MLYPNGISTCQIAGAIALAAVHDLNVNLFSFSGFPQISISSKCNSLFLISLSYFTEKRHSVIEFEISKELGFKAGEMFKTSKSYPKELFEPVQNAIAKLEGEVCKY